MEGDIRLVGNSTKRSDPLLEGTIEICSNGHWGSICGLEETASPFRSQFSSDEAKVACRQLGHSGLSKECCIQLVFQSPNSPYVCRCCLEVRCILWSWNRCYPLPTGHWLHWKGSQTESMQALCTQSCLQESQSRCWSEMSARYGMITRLSLVGLTNIAGVSWYWVEWIYKLRYVHTI